MTHSAPGPLEGAPPHQDRAAGVLAGALSQGPSHAYLLVGPAGSGKAALARAFAAGLLAEDSADPDDARRRALIDPSPHPDLVWLSPGGAGHAVADVRDRLVHVAPLSPFEGSRRVFVIERAESLGEESQNAMLKTLEEPPAHACLVLLADDRDSVLPTVASRCQLVELDPLPESAVRERLGSGVPDETATALARLSGGDPSRALFLAGASGSKVRDSIELMMAGVVTGELGGSPWLGLLETAEEAGELAGGETKVVLEAEAEQGAKLSKSDTEAAIKRAARRARTEVLAMGLGLAAAWARDWAVVAAGSPELSFNLDRIDRLSAQAEGIPVPIATEAVELVEETRRRLRLNVSEELALEALCFRLERLLGGAVVA